MDNNLNQTGATPETSNPQSATGNPSASRGSDFQSTAPTDVLNQNNVNLSVETTREPANTGTSADSSSTSVGLWVLAFAAIIVISALLIRRMSQEDALEVASAPVAKPTTTKKTAVKKKSKSTPKKRKKTTRKRR